MKTLLKLLTPVLVLLSLGLAQEPKSALVSALPKDKPTAESREQTIATGTTKSPTPVVQPKPLPTLSPTLGEIARAARAAHAASAKAQLVLDPDADADIDTVANPSEKGAAAMNESAEPADKVAAPRK